MILREGDAGATLLKRRLNALQYDCGDGDIFDRRTVWAVRWFRRKNALPDGNYADDVFMQRLALPDAILGVTTAFQYYSMKDAMWADYPYDAANTPEIEVMSNSACGPTAMAMAVSSALHRAVLPPVLADWSNASGYRDPDGIHGTSDSFFPACAKLYGMNTEQVYVHNATAFERVQDALAAGCSVISNVVPGSPFTRYGHYNLISAVKDGRIHICDPVPENNALPVFTVDEWMKNQWCRYVILVSRV